MKTARTRHSALSFLVSLSVAGSVLAAPSAATADDFLESGGLCTKLPELRLAPVPAPLAGDVVCAAGLMFQLAEDAVPMSELGIALSCPAWLCGDAGLFVAVLANAVEEVSALSLGELMAAATDLAFAMDGVLTGFSVYDNESVSAYVYDVAFAHAGRPLRGSIGFIPMGDGTLTALTCMYAEDTALELAGVLDTLYASVELNELLEAA